MFCPSNKYWHETELCFCEDLQVNKWDQEVKDYDPVVAIAHCIADDLKKVCGDEDEVIGSLY